MKNALSASVERIAPPTNPSVGKGLSNRTAAVTPHDVYYPVKFAEKREAELQKTVENEVEKLMAKHKAKEKKKKAVVEDALRKQQELYEGLLRSK